MTFGLPLKGITPSENKPDATTKQVDLLTISAWVSAAALLPGVVAQFARIDTIPIAIPMLLSFAGGSLALGPQLRGDNRAVGLLVWSLICMVGSVQLLAVGNLANALGLQ